MTTRQMIRGHYFERIYGKLVERHYAYVAVGEITEAEAVRRWEEAECWVARHAKERKVNEQR